MDVRLSQEAVGWRPESKRLLLLMTDQPSHLALDSRLAGIVTPHDGLCHLENNVYAASTEMVRASSDPRVLLLLHGYFLSWPRVGLKLH